MIHGVAITAGQSLSFSLCIAGLQASMDGHGVAVCFRSCIFL